MPKLPLVLALVALGTSHPAPAAAQPAPELTEQRRINIAAQLQRSAVVVRSGRSGGSGFIATREGWIVTNAHVVQNARSIQVRFSDGRTLSAQLIAVDRHHDLALLRAAENPNLPPLVLGDPNDVQVGQTVLAFGSPFGLDGTLTQGIVSARRDLPGPRGGTIPGVIQTDAPINPGNSGGPLTNSRGHVIGVNTAILSRSGGSHGIGFAMPSNHVRELIARARAQREQALRARRQPTESRTPSANAPTAPDTNTLDMRDVGDVWVGILGDNFEQAGSRGVRIQQVIPGGPAATAGLRGARDPAPLYVRQLGVPWTGHIIVAVDGRPVRDLEDLKRLLDGRRPGERARLTLTVGPNAVRGEAVISLQAPPRQLAQP